MKDLKTIFSSILIVGIWWALIWVASDLIFGDISQEDSYKPLWVVIPGMVIPFSILVWLYYRNNKGK